MKRIPVMSTIIVAIAVAVMIALGVWQLRRAGEKEALLAQYASNLGKPPMAFPNLGPVAPDAMFRKSSATCLSVVKWRVEAGQTPTGQPGYRQIAECRTGAEGPGLLADMGLTADPKFVTKWTGGPVDGLITTEPNHTSVITMVMGRAPVLRPMLVADVPAPGLAASMPPSPENVPNNHRAYAVQWFIFAGIALVIYGIAVRKRLKP